MPITPLPAHRVRVVESPVELEQVRWFQVTRYYEAGLTDELPASLADDPLVAKSAYFVAYSPTGEIWGTCRLIEAELEELPLWSDHVIGSEYSALLQSERSQVAEFSRLAVAVDAPQLQTVAALGRQVWRYCAERQQSTIWLGSIGTPMMNLFERGLGLPFEVMGPVIHNYYNEDSYPVLIDMVRFLLERVGSRRWHFFTDGLTIDLTTVRDPVIVNPSQPNIRLLHAS